MKKYFYLVLLAISFTACKPTTDQAIEFNDKVVDVLDRCTQSEKVFLDKCDTYDKVIIDNAYKVFKSEVESAHADLEKIECPDEFQALKDAGNNVTSTYTKLVDGDYKDYAHYYSLPDEAFGTAEEEESGKVAKNINTQLEKALMQFDVVQAELAKDFDFKISNKN